MARIKNRPCPYHGCEEMFTCQHNGKSTSDRITTTTRADIHPVDQHIREAHSSEGHSICWVCNKGFPRPWCLSRHLDGVHNIIAYTGRGKAKRKRVDKDDDATKSKLKKTWKAKKAKKVKTKHDDESPGSFKGPFASNDNSFQQTFTAPSTVSVDQNQVLRQPATIKIPADVVDNLEFNLAITSRNEASTSYNNTNHDIDFDQLCNGCGCRFANVDDGLQHFHCFHGIPQSAECFCDGCQQVFGTQHQPVQQQRQQLYVDLSPLRLTTNDTAAEPQSYTSASNGLMPFTGGDNMFESELEHSENDFDFDYICNQQFPPSASSAQSQFYICSSDHDTTPPTYFSNNEDDNFSVNMNHDNNVQTTSTQPFPTTTPQLRHAKNSHDAPVIANNFDYHPIVNNNSQPGIYGELDLMAEADFEAWLATGEALGGG